MDPTGQPRKATLEEARAKRIAHLKSKQAEAAAQSPAGGQGPDAEGQAGNKRRKTEPQENLASTSHGAAQHPSHQGGGRPPPAASRAQYDPSIDPDQTSGVPDGWLDCPPYGAPWQMFIPCKVPLGERFDTLIPLEKRFTPQMLVEQHRQQGIEIGLVIDLTNTTRYYHPIGFEKLNVDYLKLACQGRDGPPEPQVVNAFVFQVQRYLHESTKYIAVHCTHGHNRTGAMLCHYACRIMGWRVDKAIFHYSTLRPPGIYKENYIRQLFKYYHTVRHPHLRSQGTPEWKGGAGYRANPNRVTPPPDDLFSSSNQDYQCTPSYTPYDPPSLPERGPAPEWTWQGPKVGTGTVGLAEGSQERPMGGSEAYEGEIRHEDIIGEHVPEEQVEQLRIVCAELLLGRGGSQRMRTGIFPGSQPVSLEMENMSMLGERPYYVTWKADGTRYMLLVMTDGSYLIDRKFNFYRTQMFFPTKENAKVRHNLTLMDGEMVVDLDMTTGRCTRRYLVYDLMAINGHSTVEMKFGERWALIEEEVVKPRSALKGHYHGLPQEYNFGAEPFQLRRKDFWPVAQSAKIISPNFTDQLPHESDGLIFQAEEKYVPFTCPSLLKWKPANMNSVDFYLDASNPRNPKLCIQDKGRHTPLESERVTFPEGTAVGQLHAAIVECAWDPLNSCWTYMRVRPDKDMANHITTYRSVWKSITDDITEERLISSLHDMLEAKKQG